MTYIPQIDAGEVTIVPVISAEILEAVVTLPEGVDEYGDTVSLVEEIVKTIHKYVDIGHNDEEFAAWYIMMSWVYDRLDTLSYLRFEGDTGTGKSRCLDVIGKLCYKPIMMAGAVTPAPIYRLIERFRGTVILEEADFRDSTEKGEVVTILNAGFERGRPVIRCAADDPSTLQPIPCYGPKVFATRFKFRDVALEARCMIMKMEETNRDDIPPILGRLFREEIAGLRKKLLMWRLRNLNQIDPSTIDLINLENGNRLEPRLKQIGLPYAVPFQNMPDVMEKFREFMKRKQEEIIEERSERMEGLCVNALFKLSLEHGKGNVSAKMISQEITGTARTDQADEKENQKGRAIAVGRYLNELNIKTTNKRVAEQPRARYIVWSDELMRKLLRRYVVDISDFAKLFEASDELNI